MRTSRGGLTEAWPTPRMPPKPSSASCFSSQTVTSSPAAPASSDGLVGEPGRVLQVRGDGGQRPGPPAGAADGHRARQGGPVVVGQLGEHDPARPARARAAWSASGTRTSRARRRPRTARGRRRGRPRGSWWPPSSGRAPPGPERRRPGGSPGRRRVADARPAARCAGPGCRGCPRDRQGGHLAGLAGRPRGVEHREQVDVRASSPTSSAPGPSSGAAPSSPRSTGSATTSAPARSCGPVAVTEKSGGET